MQTPIHIKMSKKKIIRALLISIGLFTTGLWILINRPQIDNFVFNDAWVKYGGASCCVLFFGWGITYFIKKLFEKTPGMIIDEKGITDNSSAVTVGFIPWEDVIQIAKIEVMKQRMLLILVKNPEQYIQRQEGILKRKLMEANLKDRGTPITISAGGLQANIDEVLTMLEKQLLLFRNVH
jgi:hypothetical protein